MRGAVPGLVGMLLGSFWTIFLGFYDGGWMAINGFLSHWNRYKDGDILGEL
jgi:hypothetical protein